MFATVSELKEKEVIGICSGKRYGCVNDVEVDLSCGKVVALLLPSEESILRLGRRAPLRIPWDRIERIGPDIILVNYTAPDPKSCC